MSRSRRKKPSAKSPLYFTQKFPPSPGLPTLVASDPARAAHTVEPAGFPAAHKVASLPLPRRAVGFLQPVA